MSEGDSANAPGKIHPTFPTPKLDVGRSVCQFGPNFRPLDHSWAQTSWPQFPLSLSINCDVFPAPRGRASTSCRPTRSTCPCWRTPRTPSAKRKVQSLSVVFDTVTPFGVALRIQCSHPFFANIISFPNLGLLHFSSLDLQLTFSLCSAARANFFLPSFCHGGREGGRPKISCAKNFIFGK